MATITFYNKEIPFLLQKYIHFQLLGKEFKESSQTISVHFQQQLLELLIEIPSHSLPLKITLQTNLHFQKSNSLETDFANQLQLQQKNQVKGFEKEVQKFREWITLFSKQFSFGIIIYGMKGTGKYYFVNTLLQEQSHLFNRIIHLDLSNPSSNVSQELQSLLSSTTTLQVVILENIDTLQHNSKDLNYLVFVMDYLEQQSSTTKTLFIGITNQLDSVPVELRRSGKLELEMEIPIPSQKDRREILEYLLQQQTNSTDSINLDWLMERTNGFTVSDLQLLCNQISLQKDVQVQMVKPSAIKEIIVEVPHVKWEDIGGQTELKELLQEYIKWELVDAEQNELVQLGLKIPKGILLYGPPGNSKTMMAKALATEAKLNFIAVRGPELFSKWVGDSEKAVRQVFQKARKAKPCIVFFDEIDALAVERGSNQSGVSDRVLSQLLNEMDGLDRLEGVIIIAATNRPDILDKALIRPGRFDRMVHVKMPDATTRRQIFAIYLNKLDASVWSDTEQKDKILNWLSVTTEQYSGAECVALCREAALFALKDNPAQPQLQQSHFEKAVQNVKPRISRQVIEFYENFEKHKK